MEVEKYMKDSKFKPGDKVFYIHLYNNDTGRSFMDLSIEIIDQVCLDKNGIITYWIPSWHEEIHEEELLPYDENIFSYIEKNLNINDDINKCM